MPADDITPEKPEHLSVGYRELIRSIYGMSPANRDPKLIRHLLSWGYLKESKSDGYEVTEDGMKAMGGEIGWTVYNDPRYLR
jgi:hypothetical protein